MNSFALSNLDDRRAILLGGPDHTVKCGLLYQKLGARDRWGAFLRRDAAGEMLTEPLIWIGADQKKAVVFLAIQATVSSTSLHKASWASLSALRQQQQFALETFLDD